MEKTKPTTRQDLKPYLNDLKYALRVIRALEISISPRLNLRAIEVLLQVVIGDLKHENTNATGLARSVSLCSKPIDTSSIHRYVTMFQGSSRNKSLRFKYITQVPSPKDQRLLDLKLTPSGLKAIRRLVKELRR